MRDRRDSPFDLAAAFARDRVIWGIATGAAALAVFVGLRLLATANLASTGGLLRGAGGALLCVSALVAFRAYWKRI
jgi:hypothetical protein